MGVIYSFNKQRLPKKLYLSQWESSVQKTNYMELSEVIIGTKLNEIQKRSDGVKLVFEDTKAKKIYILTFTGLLFETSTPTLNKRVNKIQLNNVLGYRAMSQLRHQKLNPHKYRQLFIQMEGSNENNKLELLGALTNYRVSSRSPSTARKTAAKKIAAKKTSIKNRS